MVGAVKRRPEPTLVAVVMTDYRCARESRLADLYHGASQEKALIWEAGPQNKIYLSNRRGKLSDVSSELKRLYPLGGRFFISGKVISTSAAS